jgi:hypothetical protein
MEDSMETKQKLGFDYSFIQRIYFFYFFSSFQCTMALLVVCQPTIGGSSSPSLARY